MFAKPFKIKSNNSLKNSEKKHLVQRIVDEFPAATEEVAKELVHMKSSCSCVKVMVHSGEMVDVYVVNGAPLLLEVRGGLLPTVAALWRAPGLLPALTVHEPVLDKIRGGAPLYSPGVVVPAGGAGWPAFARGAALALRTPDNAAAAAVGRAALASGEMLLKLGGVCMELVHWAGDALCREPRLGRLQRPRLGPGRPGAGDELAEQMHQLHIPHEEWPALGRAVPATASAATATATATAAATAAATAPQDPATASAATATATATAAATAAATAPQDPATASAATATATAAAATAAATAPQDSAPETKLQHTDKSDNAERAGAEAGAPRDMDALLEWALLSFLKLHARSVQLPLLASLLYRNYLLPLCPPNRTLDVKKSSYKKVGKFLEAMEKEGYLQVRELGAGVDAVTALHAAHPRLRSHAPPPAPAAPPAPHYSPPRVRELFSVTAAAADLLNLKKGSLVSAGELRAALTAHVRARALAAPAGGVVLDAALARTLQAQEQDIMKWDALMAGIQGRLTPCTEMSFADGTSRLIRAKLDPIRMQVVTRSGNKKVTLVSNLEAFGFTLSELARACQRGVAASCGVTRSPGSKFDQLTLQGDQQYYVAKLLIETYGLPKKFVEGADKALKKKKGS